MRELQATERAIALERGTLFSLFQELRFALYVAVAMIATGVGLWLKDHLDRIEPLAIIGVLGVAAAGCYATAIHQRLRGRTRSLGGDYLLLLGALLLSANLGYAETQFHWLGERWSLHLLVLAAWHALIAYWLDSRLVLSVALASLAAWFGIETALGPTITGARAPIEFGGRALTCAAALFVWRGLNYRDGRRLQFQPVFEHFATNLAFLGAVAWSYSASRSWLGLTVALALAALSIARGLRLRDEVFVVYGVCYGALATGAALSRALDDALATAMAMLLIVASAATALWLLHQRLKQADR
jgi:hypothetical protein